MSNQKCKVKSKQSIDLAHSKERLEYRKKQISYGKNTEEYIKLEKHFRPKTPELDDRVGKRMWDGKCRKWRRDLHAFYNEQKSLEQRIAEMEKSLEQLWTEPMLTSVS
jgi:hypothetical protein